MTEHRCTNCGSTAADTYELLIRSRSHEEVPLCEACHEAIRAELDG
jgi:NAD-dependent SIR2 family protein deacetylase